MEKYVRTWKECREAIFKNEYVWKVIDLPDGSSLWEENEIGRLFIIEQSGKVWETEF